MTKVSVDVRGLDAVERLLGRRGVTAHKTAEYRGVVIQGMAEETRDALVKYPPRRYGAKMEFKSDKQRRGFFAKLRAGEIQVPYRRRMQLAKGWVIAKRGGNAMIGNRIQYAPYVQGPDEQTAMHSATGWDTTREVTNKLQTQGVYRRVVQEVTRQFVRMLKGGF